MRAYPETSSADGKRAYASPKLTTYGSVRDLTGAGSQTSNDGNNTKAAPASDPRYKENAVRIGEHPAGFGIYLFDYRSEYRDAFGHGRQFGVMADEVERVVPSAVLVDANGYRRVDHTQLGITRH